MSKLKTREDVIERYWPDYIKMCMLSLDGDFREFEKTPTVDNFWVWYITDGPMGIKHKGRFYMEEKVEYL